VSFIVWSIYLKCSDLNSPALFEDNFSELVEPSTAFEQRVKDIAESGTIQQTIRCGRGADHR